MTCNPPRNGKLTPHLLLGGIVLLVLLVQMVCLIAQSRECIVLDRKEGRKAGLGSGLGIPQGLVETEGWQVPKA